MLHPNLNKKVGTTFGLETIKGEFGVELEIEGTKLPTSINGWYSKREDSLRGEALEYVTQGAYNMADLRTALDTLHAALTKEGTTATLSKRASTHIHLNMQKETFHTVLGFITLWTMLEPVTLRLCGPLRNGNLFCMPALETGDLPLWMHRVSQRLLSPYPFSDFPGRGKYATLNVDPIRSFGSLEARCFPVSITPDEVCRWASWMANIKEIVRDWPDKSFKSLVDYAYNEPNALIAAVFSDQGNVFSACQPNNPYDLIHAGVEIGYEMVKSAEPILEYKEKKAPEKATKKRTLLDLEANSFEEFITVTQLDAPQPAFAPMWEDGGPAPDDLEEY